MRAACIQYFCIKTARRITDYITHLTDWPILLCLSPHSQASLTAALHVCIRLEADGPNLLLLQSLYSLATVEPSHSLIVGQVIVLGFAWKSLFSIKANKTLYVIISITDCVVSGYSRQGEVSYTYKMTMLAIILCVFMLISGLQAAPNPYKLSQLSKHTVSGIICDISLVTCVTFQWKRFLISSQLRAD